MKSKTITGLLLALVAVLLFVADIAWLWVLVAFLAAFVGYFEAHKLYELSFARIFSAHTASSAVIASAETSGASEVKIPTPAPSDKALGAALIVICSCCVLFSNQISPLNIALIACFGALGIAAFRAHSFAAPFALFYAFCGVFCLLDIYFAKGSAYLLWLVICVCASDSAAYFAGKKFGKTSFSPSSPNKTFEGVAAGLIAALVIGGVWAYFVLQFDLRFALLASLALGVISALGDLFESRLKRLAGVKDSGDIFPAHGGVLDRLDAMIFAAVLAKLAL